MAKTIWTNKRIRKLIYNKSKIKVLKKGKNSVVVEVYTPKKIKSNDGSKKPRSRWTDKKLNDRFASLDNQLADIKSILLNFVTEQREFNAWVKDVFKRNNLK